MHIAMDYGNAVNVDLYPQFIVPENGILYPCKIWGDTNSSQYVDLYINGKLILTANVIRSNARLAFQALPVVTDDVITINVNAGSLISSGGVFVPYLHI